MKTSRVALDLSVKLSAHKTNESFVHFRMSKVAPNNPKNHPLWSIPVVSVKSNLQSTSQTLCVDSNDRKLQPNKTENVLGLIESVKVMYVAILLVVLYIIVACHNISSLTPIRGNSGTN